MATEVVERPLKDQRLVLMVDSPTREALEKLSDDTGAPLSELARRALASWLKNHESRLSA